MVTSWTALLDRAIRAPSPHNVQPWKVRVTSENDATLFLDLERVLPYGDRTGSFLISTMTLFLETLSITAHASGQQITYELAAELDDIAAQAVKPTSQTLPFAKIARSDAAVTPLDFDARLLDLRRTARMAYTSDPLSKEARIDLERTAALHGFELGTTADATAIEEIKWTNIQALFYDLNDPGYHDEIAQWFRCGPKEEERYRDGLSSRCMNMLPAELALAKKHPSILRIPGLKRIIADYYMNALRCRTIGWLRGPFWQPAAALAAGHGLMRFWLTATKHDLSIHPLGNLVTNSNAARAVEAITGAKEIWLIFKLGKAAKPVPQSLRRPLEDFLL
jgi:hypothetical protein